ncbi:MAG: site-2 protease family protein [Fimbriiglobus sp.]
MTVTIGLYLVASLVAWYGIQAAYVFAQAVVGAALGATVKEVSVGYGPAVWEWSGLPWKVKLGAIPLGGYTSFRGFGGDDDDDRESDEPQPGDIANLPIPSRAIIMLVGPATNLAIGVILLALPVAVGAGQVVRGDAGRPVVPSGFGPLAVTDTPATLDGQLRLVEAPLLDTVGRLLTFRSLGEQGGYVAVGSTMARAGADSPWAWATILGLVAIGCGVFNLAPVPGLNGGHLVFLALEAVAGRRTAESVSLPLLWVGLLYVMIVMGRLFVADVQWLYSVL